MFDKVSFRWRVAMALAVVYVVWGTTYYALSVAMRTLPPVAMNGARFFLAGLVMLVWARWQGQGWPTARQWGYCALIGTLMVFAAMALALLALHHGIGSGMMATVVATMPMWLTLWSRLSGERVAPSRWLGLVLGVMGASVLAMEGDFQATPLGAVFAFASPLCWSLGSFASRRLVLPSAGMSAAAQWLCGGAVGLVVALALEPGVRTFSWQAVSAESWWAWLYLVVLGTLLTLNCYLWLLHNTSMALAGSYSFVNPLVALAVGVVWAEEPLNGWVFAALPLILGGLGLIIYGGPLRGCARRGVRSGPAADELAVTRGSSAP